jgi:hypothetical protein
MSGQWIRPSRVSYWVAGTLPAGTLQSPPRPARRARFTNTASGIAVNASARLSTCDSASLAGPIFSDEGSAGDDASAGTAPLRRSGSVGTSRSIGVVPACQSTSIARDSLVRIRTNTDKRSTCRGPAVRTVHNRSAGGTSIAALPSSLHPPTNRFFLSSSSDVAPACPSGTLSNGAGGAQAVEMILIACDVVHVRQDRVRTGPPLARSRNRSKYIVAARVAQTAEQLP